MAGVYTVTEINNYITNMFRQDFVLNRVSIKGEVSNCKYHPSGHIYFTLKDADSTLKGIMFRSQTDNLTFRLDDGMKVIVDGRISVYTQTSQYQIYADQIRQEGIGELRERYEKLKQYFADMGYFAEQYKQAIPPFAMKIGIVTADSGAAVQDIINISKRRNPYVSLYLYPALVQGENAKYSITAGIEKLDTLGLDCIIVGRGGGSIEDLWAFNEEMVVEAVFNAQTPIISAVGHETDFTLCDFVADRRASTPSAAAELAVTEWSVFEQSFSYRQETFVRLMQDRIRERISLLEKRSLQLEKFSPEGKLSNQKQRLKGISSELSHLLYRKLSEANVSLNSYSATMQTLMDAKLSASKTKLSVTAAKLTSANPLKILTSGYAYVEDENGSNIRSASQLLPKQTVKMYFKDGTATAQIKTVTDRDFDLKK